MESGRDEGGVPLSMIPLLEVAYSKCQEEEKDTQKGSWITQEETAGKKRKRSSNWSEAETLELLLLRKGQLQNKDDRKACPKGSSAWDEIAAQLKEKFTPRSGKHVGERWDTLRRVYMDIEERCSKTQKTYAQILDANRELFKFIPTEYTHMWHELIADCKPGKRRGKKPIESGNSPAAAAPSKAVEDYSVTSYRAPVEACSEGNPYVQRESSPTSVAQSPGIASAFGTLIKDVERVISCRRKQDKSCGRKYARRGRDSDERADANGVELSEDTCDAMEMNVVSSLQSVLAALKSTSEFTSSGESCYLPFRLDFEGSCVVFVFTCVHCFTFLF